MPRYDVTAWCSLPHYTIFEVEAASVEEALARAQTQVNDECAEPCNSPSYEWNEFELCSEDAGEYVFHLEPDRAAESAAQTLLDALRTGVATARDLVGRWERGDLAQAVRALALWLPTAESAIEQALKP